MNEQSLQGVAMVTGAGQGIGRAIALRLLGFGCPLLAVGRTEAKLHTLHEEAGVDENRVLVAAVDISDSAQIEQALLQCEAQLGSIRYLVNAAGVLSPSRLLDTPAVDIRKTIDINFTATLLLTQATAKLMILRQSGAIVTISSNSGTTPRTALGAYPASKAGLNQAMKCLGLELAEYGIRCNLVSPGSTDTPMQRSFQTKESDFDGVINGDLDRWRLGIPLRRMAEPDDVADLVLFLLSDQARHITMENIVIDGGATLGAR